jgi:hypothetical protein
MKRVTLGMHIGLIAAVVALAAHVSAQPANPRFGRWKLKSEAPAPQSNIMTYEAFNGTGMKITIETTSATGAKGGYSYTTMFDDKFLPATGQANNTYAVHTLNDKINEIVNKVNDKFSRLLINVLSADNKSILVTYISTNATTGETRVTYATYEKIE